MNTLNKQEERAERNFGARKLGEFGTGMLMNN